ncbi:MAG: translation initiation factor IF-2 [bacterium]
MNKKKTQEAPKSESKFQCRVSELAHEIGITSKDLMEHLAKNKIKVKQPSSGLTSAQVAVVKKALAPSERKIKTPAPVKKESAPKKKIPEKEQEKVKAAPSTAPVSKAPRKTSKYAAVVYVFAKDLGVTSSTLIEKITSFGITGKKPNSGLTEEEVKKIKAEFFAVKPKETAVARKKEKEVEEKPAEPVLKPEPPPPSRKVIKLDVTTTIANLADKLGLASGELIKKLLKQGIITTINQRLDLETASLIVQEEGFEPEVVDIYKDEIEKSDDRDASRARLRSPIVTVMGHVDHGKTSLLDYIRKSHIIQKESGSITQHIGAYQIKHKNSLITFIDTPGHEAFTAMRLRGAQVTDIIVLVIAADDGIMPQTQEAISHARLAGVPIIAAVNKMDLPHANLEKVKQQLSRENLLPEDWGGKTVVVPISAKTGLGVGDLLDIIELQAEMMQIKVDTECRARGVVLDAQLDTRRGPVATILVTAGSLKIGNPFICGFSGGKVRAMHLEGGKMARDILPGTPVEVMGFTDLPEAGDEFFVIENENLSRNILASRKRIREAMKLKPASTENVKEDDKNTVKIILKTDVIGSLEAIKDALSKLSNPEVHLNVVHAACGGINKSDVLLAQASKSMIVGFNVRGDVKATSEANEKGVEIRTYTVIYQLMDDIKKALEGKLTPTYKEVHLGRAEVRKIFNISRLGTVAGCIATDGKILRSSRVRILRDNKIIYTGKLSSLKRFQDDVSEVLDGQECGIMAENYNDIKPADIFEAYELQKIARDLDTGGA